MPSSDARRRFIMRAAGVGACLLGLVAVASLGQSSRSELGQTGRGGGGLARSVELLQAGWGGGGPALTKGQRAVISASVIQDAQLEKMHEDWAEERERHLRKMIALRVTADKHEASKRAHESAAESAKAILLAQERLYRKHVVASAAPPASLAKATHDAPTNESAVPVPESAQEAASSSQLLVPPVSQLLVSLPSPAAPTPDAGTLGEVAYLRQHAVKLERRAELRSHEREARDSYRQVPLKTLQ